MTEYRDDGLGRRWSSTLSSRMAASTAAARGSTRRGWRCSRGVQEKSDRLVRPQQRVPDRPIGRMSATEGDRLIGTCNSPPRARASAWTKLIGLVEQGVLRAVSVGFSIVKLGSARQSEFDYEEQDLLEVSLVGCSFEHQRACYGAFSQHSESTIHLAFGEHAEPGRSVVSPGRHATKPPVTQRQPAMKTLSQRIEDAQADLVAKRDRLVELNAADELDLDAIEALNRQIEVAQRTIEASQDFGGPDRHQRPARQWRPCAPPAIRRPLGAPIVNVRAASISSCAAAVSPASPTSVARPVERVLEERYPGHEATHALVTRADQTIGTTTVSGWARNWCRPSIRASCRH